MIENLETYADTAAIIMCAIYAGLAIPIAAPEAISAIFGSAFWIFPARTTPGQVSRLRAKTRRTDITDADFTYCTALIAAIRGTSFLFNVIDKVVSVQTF